MTERESAIEKYLVAQVEARGGKCFKFGPPGLVGYPDRLVILPAVPAFFVEVKRPRGGRFSALQPIRHEELRALGVAVYVVRNRGEVDDVIRGKLGRVD